MSRCSGSSREHRCERRDTREPTDKGVIKVQQNGMKQGLRLKRCICLGFLGCFVCSRPGGRVVMAQTGGGHEAAGSCGPPGDSSSYLIDNAMGEMHLIDFVSKAITSWASLRRRLSACCRAVFKR